jgi:hypothetical protein
VRPPGGLCHLKPHPPLKGSRHAQSRIARSERGWAPLSNPTGQSPRAAVSVSNARAEASRQNGARSRGPKSEEGKARSAQNALKHGMRAQKHLVLPEEDAAEFVALEAALIEELAPVGALQTVLEGRVAIAAWRLARADRIETELFQERRGPTGGLGLALIRDGNGARSFETRWREPAPTLVVGALRYRGARSDLIEVISRAQLHTAPQQDRELGA